MKPFIRILVLTVSTLMLATSLRAQALWPDTKAGMSLEEVQKQFPNAHEPDNPAVLPAEHGTELLAIDQVEIAGHKFHVQFFFNHDERLVQVTLFESGEIPAKEFERFRGLLRAKYGLEYSTTSSEWIQLEWHVIQTILRLRWTPLASGPATLTITYAAPIPRETDRL